MTSNISLGRIDSTSKSITSRPSVSDHRLPSPAPSDEDGVSQAGPSRDVEASADAISPDDPWSLRTAIKSESELASLRNRSPNGKSVEAYQRRQNDLISLVLKPMEAHTDDARVAEEGTRVAVTIAVYASLCANFCLCILQLYAAITAGSLSILATAIDSVFDLGSNLMLFYIHRKAERLDVNKWPVGGSRLESIGNIVYGSLMSSVNLVVIVESVRVIIQHTNGDTNKFHLPSILAVSAALGVKFCLFLYCFSLRGSSSQVRVLWEDHRNDLFVNSFGVLMSAGGSKLRWWLDPVGGGIIAIGVIAAWTKTVYHEFELLAGKSAPHEFIHLLIYNATTFSDDIEKVDTVRAYHSGPDYFVEIDIVMSSETPLWRAHDVAQELQDKIELLPGVDRAFVHVDHETTHAPEHRKHV